MQACEANAHLMFKIYSSTINCYCLVKKVITMKNGKRRPLNEPIKTRSKTYSHKRQGGGGRADVQRKTFSPRLWLVGKLVRYYSQAVNRETVKRPIYNGDIIFKTNQLTIGIYASQINWTYLEAFISKMIFSGTTLLATPFLIDSRTSV